MKTVNIYTDGACSGNPGPGGWAAILKYGEAVKELSGGEISAKSSSPQIQNTSATLCKRAGRGAGRKRAGSARTVNPH